MRRFLFRIGLAYILLILIIACSDTGKPVPTLRVGFVASEDAQQVMQNAQPIVEILRRRHPCVYYAARSALNLIRTIPDLALGLLFVAAVGLGAFAGTLALAVHTATVLGKLLSDSAENIDEAVVEALRATGAGYSQIRSFAVLSQILPDLISFTLSRLETNIRAASVLGLIGAAASAT